MTHTTAEDSQICSASRKLDARWTPFSFQFLLRVITTLRRPGSGRNRSGSESQVLRPMMTG